MKFEVRTLAADLSITQIDVEGLDEADVRRQMAARGLFVTEISIKRGASRTRDSHFSLLMFSQELLALQTAGLGIVEALEALLEKEANGFTGHVLARLLSGLREGSRFSAVLAQQPEQFPPLFVGIVQAAEGTSDLPRSLARFIEYQQRIDLVRGKIISAAIYPLILLAVGLGVSAFLIGYVVPRFAEVYSGAGRNLPWMSQMMLNWGKFVSGHTLLLLTLLATIVVPLILGVRRVLANGGAVRLLAGIPGITERVRIFELSRLYLTLGMLCEGGITIVQAIRTVQGMVSPAVRSALLVAGASIESGLPLSQAFEANGLTTPISLRLLRVGERTGDMGPMLRQSAAFYDGEINRWIERFTRTFEPLLMAAIGLIVGGIVVLLYMPIFDLAGDMS